MTINNKDKLFNRYKTQEKLLVLCFLIVCVVSFGCDKYLDQKTQKSLVIPNSADDLIALLDNNNVVNVGSSPFLEMLSDNFYLTSTDWNTQSVNNPEQALNYIWSSEAPPHNASWITAYQGPIYYSNIVIDEIDKIQDDNVGKSDYVKGAAFFYRAFAYFQLSQIFCKPYSATSQTDLGLVLKLTSDINEKSTRSTVSQTYEQIVKDLMSASELLPAKTVYKTRPNKTASYGLLARVYLSMRDYSNALSFSDKCLSNYDSLIDYNSLLPIGTPPIPTFNKEVIYHNIAFSIPFMQPSRAKIDSNLINSYAENDLRKTVFFSPNRGANLGTFGFRGSYNGSRLVYNIFDGIATDEMYLIRAECKARIGNFNDALVDLNKLMVNRWRQNEFLPFSAIDKDEAKNIILRERRKELVYRGIRWSDLRRFNLEGENITLRRLINNTEYILTPGDKRWVVLLPWDVINRSGIEQNPR